MNDEEYKEMYEKFDKYISLTDNKSLIQKRIPSPEDILKFEEVKKELRKNSLIGMIFIFILDILVVLGPFFSQATFSISLIFVYIFCSFLTIWIVKKYKEIPSYKLEYCDYGVIVDKYMRGAESRHVDKEHYIIVSANQNLLKFKPPRELYPSLNINDTVTIFAVENKSHTFISYDVK